MSHKWDTAKPAILAQRFSDWQEEFDARRRMAGTAVDGVPDVGGRGGDRGMPEVAMPGPGLVVLDRDRHARLVR